MCVLGKLKMIFISVAFPDPGSGAFLPPGSGSGMSFSGSRILDSEGKFFVEIFLNYIKNPCSFLLVSLAPETVRSKKKVGFIFHPSSRPNAKYEVTGT
jgi:hypothetical protein